MAIKKKKMEVIISESDYLFFQGISVISESLKLDHYLKEAERCLSHIEVWLSTK